MIIAILLFQWKRRNKEFTTSIMILNIIKVNFI